MTDLQPAATAARTPLTIPLFTESPVRGRHRRRQASQDRRRQRPGAFTGLGFSPGRSSPLLANKGLAPQGNALHGSALTIIDNARSSTKRQRGRGTDTCRRCALRNGVWRCGSQRQNDRSDSGQRRCSDGSRPPTGGVVISHYRIAAIAAAGFHLSSAEVSRRPDAPLTVVLGQREKHRAD